MVEKKDGRRGKKRRRGDWVVVSPEGGFSYDDLQNIKPTKTSAAMGRAEGDLPPTNALSQRGVRVWK